MTTSRLKYTQEDRELLADPHTSYHDREVIRKKSYIKDWLDEMAASTLDNLPPEIIDSMFREIVSNHCVQEPADALLRFMKEARLAGTSPSASYSTANSTELEHTCAAVEVDYDKTLTTGEVAELIGCQINTVKNRMKQLKLVGYRLKQGDDYKLPQWQFSGKTVVKGVDTVLRELEHNGVAAVRKMTVPLADFNDLTIINVLHQGDIEKAIEMAKQLKD